MTQASSNQPASIESVIYLGSLVSDRQRVDEMLDGLRMMTAAMATPNQPLTNEQHQTLDSLQSDLKEYLVTKETLGSFTPESLDALLAFHTAEQDPAYTKRRTAVVKQIAIIFGLALAAYALALVFTPTDLPFVTRLMLASPLFLIQFHVGLAWLFLSARKHMAAEIRRSYVYICVGMLIAVVASVQFPLLFVWPELTNQPLLRYGGFMPPFPLLCFMYYLAMHTYATKLAVHNRLTSLVWLAIAFVVVGVVGVIVPHPSSAPEEAFFDMAVVSGLLSSVFSLAAGFEGFRIVRRVTERYAKGVRLFAWAQVATAFASLAITSVIFVNGPVSGLIVALAATPFMVSEALLLLSAYWFKRNMLE